MNISRRQFLSTVSKAPLVFLGVKLLSACSDLEHGGKVSSNLKLNETLSVGDITIEFGGFTKNKYHSFVPILNIYNIDGFPLVMNKTLDNRKYLLNVQVEGKTIAKYDIKTDFVDYAGPINTHVFVEVEFYSLKK